MPFETPLPTGFFDVSDITANFHEEGGVVPSTVLRTNQRWHVDVHWDTSGAITGWIAGNWDIHVYLESMGPGVDYDLTDPNEHVIPLTPRVSPIPYDYHPDFDAGIVTAGVYKLVFTVRYVEPSGNPGEMAGYWEGPILQFINP